MNTAFYNEQLERTLLYHSAGKITKSLGLIYEAHLPGASVGSICRILQTSDPHSEQGIDAEVVGFKDKRVILMPFEEASHIHNDSLVVLKKRSSTVLVGKSLLGRVMDGRGVPIDSKGPLLKQGEPVEERSLYQKPTHPLERQMITEPLDLGIGSINGLLTCGKGQRVGIMAGSGVGKSVLLGMMARHTSADVNVVALIGERGREVREFIERELGAEGLARSVVIVSTSDKSPLCRMRGAFLAATVAEYFRDLGLDVLFLMDSITRFCMAQREIGLSQGEPPTSKGYTPSVFSTLPKLLERFGMAPRKGSITGLLTVLVENDDMDEPIADSTRAILDGHFVLSRKMAQRNQYPAIDILLSTSRVMKSVTSQEHSRWAAQVREWMSLYDQVEDLINIGAYSRGSQPKIDQAIFVHDKIMNFLTQSMEERSPFSESLAALQSICLMGEAFLQQKKK